MNHKSRRRGVASFVVAGFMTLAVMPMAFPVALRAEIVEQILVKVNGEIFTKSDLENRQVLALRQKGEPFDLKTDPANQQLRKALDGITPCLLVDVVDDLLIVQRGKELGYKLADDQFKSIVDNIRRENKLESDEQFQAALKQEGLTMADLRRNLERQMIVSRVQQNEVFNKVGISDEEGRAYYQAHVSEFTTPATISLREVLVAVSGEAKGVNVAQDEAARGRAELIRARLAAGSDNFETIASDVSDAPSKANGGLIGPLGMNDLSPDLRKVIEPMKVGDVSAVLRTPRGYQILKLESSTQAQTAPFEVAREQISERVVTGKRREEFEKYLVKLRAQAIIEFKNPDIKKAYDEGLKQAPATSAAP